MTDAPLNESDLKAAEPSALVKLAAAIQGISGLFVGLSGLQVVGLRWHPEFLGLLTWAMMLCGVLQIGFAAQVYRARPWAAFAAAGLGGLTAILMIGWFFVTFPGMISCMVVVSVPVSILSAILAVAAIGGVRATAAARQRLADQGMSLGL